MEEEGAVTHLLQIQTNNSLTTAAPGNSLVKKEVSVIRFASQEPALCLSRTEKGCLLKSILFNEVRSHRSLTKGESRPYN